MQCLKCSHLFNLKFHVCICVCEEYVALCQLITLQTCVKRIRLDMPVTDADFVSQTTDDIDEGATVNIELFILFLYNHTETKN